MTRSVVVAINVIVIIAAVANGVACLPPPQQQQQQPPRRDGLPAGAALDDDTVEIAATLQFTPEDPPELIAHRVNDALLQAGFGVRSVDGFVLEFDEHPQHITFEEGDLTMIGVALQQGVSITVDDYVLVLEALAEGAGAPGELRSAFLGDIAAAAASDEEAVRASAQLLVALGRQAPAPYDLLDPDVDGTALLDALQLGLITFRLAPELWRAAQTAGSTSEQGLDGARPCTQTDAEQLTLDGFATATGLQWGLILDHLAEKLPAAEAVANRLSLANAALIYGKLVWTMAAFRGSVSVTPQPLERNNDGSLAQDGTATARFSLDGTGAAQVINCIRPALNLAGLDFSLPQDGPLAGKAVEWRLEAKGRDDVLQTQAAPGQSSIDGETTADGTAKLTLVGKARTAIAEPVVDVHARPVLRAFTNLKNKDFAQDIIDAAAGLGGLGALVGLPAELMNRIPLAFNAATTVVVNDKKSLDGGLFTIVGEYTDPDGTDVSLFPTQFATDIRDHFEATLEINGHDDQVLTWTDSDTQVVDTFEPEQINGEGCTLTTTADGKLEIFTSAHKEELTVRLIDAVPAAGVEEQVFVNLLSYGVSRGRGFQFRSNDAASCPTGDDLDRDARDELIGIAFDSTMFDGVGTSTVIDQRQGGAGPGWVWTITFSNKSE